MLLLAGGVWGLALAAIFLVRRGDIRIIPALAGALLLVLSIGPWNYAHLPLQHQLFRLDTLVLNAGADQTLTAPRGNWSADDIAEARNLIDYLVGSREGRQGVRQVMGRYGVTWPADSDGSYAVLAALGQSREVAENLPRYTTVWRDLSNQPVDVSATPYLLRPLGIYGDSSVDTSPVRFDMKAGVLSVGPYAGGDATMVPLDLTDWLASQDTTQLVQPWIDFTVAGHNYRFALTSLNFDLGENNLGPRALSSLDGQLFSDSPTPVLAPPMPTP
jgi:hypothetical protein